MKNVRLNVLWKISKRKKPQRCAFCLKALRERNKSGLCVSHIIIEMGFNRYYQGFRKRNKI